MCKLSVHKIVIITFMLPTVGINIIIVNRLYICMHSRSYFRQTRYISIKLYYRSLTINLPHRPNSTSTTRCMQVLHHKYIPLDILFLDFGQHEDQEWPSIIYKLVEKRLKHESLIGDVEVCNCCLDLLLQMWFLSFIHLNMIKGDDKLLLLQNKVEEVESTDYARIYAVFPGPQVTVRTTS